VELALRCFSTFMAQSLLQNFFLRIPFLSTHYQYDGIDPSPWRAWHRE
jgi:hypothetical protein